MPKMFSVKGFAAGTNVTQSSESAAAAIMASSTAVSIAAPKPAESSVELQTSVIEELRKGGWINAAAVPNCALWTKVPRSMRMLAASSRG